MSKHKHTDKLCYSIIALTLLVTLLFMNGAALGIEQADRVMGYENRLFDTSRVHTLDIVMEDWESFIDTCTNDEYSMCNVVIDGESYKNIGIRAKGNSSLSTVGSYGNDRYSFKLEFDQYNTMGSYHGLDKLSLNNIIQDNTYLKDYLTYTMMNDMGVAAPLCSFIWITVNGEDWGLYLAVEAIEDSFLKRNYGNNHGELYKPDSMSMGGGRGNGRDFDINEFFNSQNEGEENNGEVNGNTYGGFELPEGFSEEAFEGMFGGMGGGMGGGFPGMGGQMPEGLPEMGEQLPDASEQQDRWNDMGGGFGGRGSNDVMLQYTDDDPDSYPNIFGNAKTDITEADQARLIASLKALSEGENIENIVDVEAVIRYFAVHDFVVNGDSYTGSMVHNYYLYEENGMLSMLPWDYNLAFGSFNMGGGMSFGGSALMSAGMTSSVNSPIDSPVSSGDVNQRPMVAWIFENGEYTALYHEVYAELVETYFSSGYFTQMMNDVIALISPYVEKEPNAFCTFEEFQKGAAALIEFCTLRARSVSGQLEGTIPSTQAGQSADSSALVDASHLSSSDMGSMGMGGGGMGGRGDRENTQRQPENQGENANSWDRQQMPNDGFGGQNRRRGSGGA